jgi:hypothetical protein
MPSSSSFLFLALFNLQIYVAWQGTDASGRYMTSTGAFFHVMVLLYCIHVPQALVFPNDAHLLSPLSPRSIALHWSLKTGARQSQFRAYGVSAAYASVTQSISDYNVRFIVGSSAGSAIYFHADHLHTQHCLVQTSHHPIQCKTLTKLSFLLYPLRFIVFSYFIATSPSTLPAASRPTSKFIRHPVKISSSTSRLLHFPRN